MCDFNISEDILRDGCDNTGGLAVTAYWAKHDDIESFPEPVASPATYEEVANASGTFTMKAGKFFRTIKGDLEMLSLNNESQGGPNNLSNKASYKFQQAGHSPQLTGFIQAEAHEDLIFVIEDADGKKRILGSRLLPAKMESFAQNTGEKTGDIKMTSFIVYAPGRLPLFFDDVIPLEPAP